MFQLLMIAHIVLCIFLIIVVLLQQGKGADAGATFGGSSNTVFGASGASTILTKATTGTAVAFIVTALLLVKMYPQSLGGAGTSGADVLSDSVMSPESQTQDSAPAASKAAPDSASDISSQ